MRAPRAAVALVVLAALAAVPSPAATAADPPPPAAPAAEPFPLTLSAGVAERGWIRARLTGTPGSAVTITEQVAGVPRPVATLTLLTAASGRRHLAPWRCDRTYRTFVLTETQADGSTRTASSTVDTPACRRRLTLELSSGRVRAGRAFTVAVGDRFGVGDVTGSVCLEATGVPACRTVRIPAGARSVRVRLTPRTPGPAAVVLSGPGGQRVTRTVHVRRRPGALTLLTTGDSDIQILQDLLADRVRPLGVQTVKDDHISTGLSGSFLLDWQAHAKAIAASAHPDVTVMFIGGNEGSAMRTPSGATAPCCGTAWVAEYARRARGIMRSLSRGGAGRVYWLLIPAPGGPRSETFKAIIRAVNRSIELAARSYPDTVRVVDLRRRFPAGSARQPDGYHLTGDSYRRVARLVFALMRSDGVV